jgi:hypothetical protein
MPISLPAPATVLLPQALPEKRPEPVSEKRPEALPEKRPEPLPEKPPERLPVPPPEKPPEKPTQTSANARTRNGARPSAEARTCAVEPPVQLRPLNAPPAFCVSKQTQLILTVVYVSVNVKHPSFSSSHSGFVPYRRGEGNAPLAIKSFIRLLAAGNLTTALALLCMSLHISL